jgi:hypothetical protein
VARNKCRSVGEIAVESKKASWRAGRQARGPTSKAAPKFNQRTLIRKRRSGVRPGAGGVVTQIPPGRPRRRIRTKQPELLQPGYRALAPQLPLLGQKTGFLAG